MKRIESIARLRLRVLVSLAVALSAGLLAPAATRPSATSSPSSRQQQWAQAYSRWVKDLADESMEGRGLGTKGLAKARDYLVEQFKAMGRERGPQELTESPTARPRASSQTSRSGLLPAFGDSYLQEVEIPLGVEVRQQALSIVDAKGKLIAEAAPGRDLNALGFSANGSFGGPAVLVGYGIVSKEHDYDSYAGLKGQSLRGKVAVAFRFEPQDQAGKSRWAKGSEWTGAATLASKAKRAAEHGAAALLVVNPPSRAAETVLHTARWTGSAEREEIPVVHIALPLLRRMMEAGGDGEQALQDLQARADKGGGTPVELKGVQLRGQVELKWTREVAHNVAAVLPGAGGLADQAVLIGAHYDHLGYGGFASRARGRTVHPGADDNASGTAGMLILAQWYAQRAAAPDAPPSRRTLIFAAFAGEERGLFGSRHLAGHLGELGIKPGQLVAMVNLDMIGRLKETHLAGDGPAGQTALSKQAGRIVLGGVETSEGWKEIVDEAARRARLSVGPGGFLVSSDHASFYWKGVPVLAFCTGLNPDIHTPRDTPEKINVPGALRVLEFADVVVARLWTDAAPPRFKPVGWLSGLGVAARPAEPGQGGAYLGVRADEAVAEGGGCKLIEVRPDTPAARAGLRSGDAIVAWEQTPVADLKDLLSRLAAAKPDQTVTLRVRRDGKELGISVKLGRR